MRARVLWKSSVLAGLWFLLATSVFAGWTVLRSDSGGEKDRLTVVRKVLARDGREVAIELAVFSGAVFDLHVADNPDGNRSLPEAMKSAGAIAGVNGGYFHDDKTPLGLVVSRGQTIHRFESARLLSGLIVQSRRGIAIMRSKEYLATKPAATEALQSGPMLVDGGNPVPGLEATRRARRTAVLWDGKSRFAFLASDSVTLAELGSILSTPALTPELKPVRALNLDGGSSTAFWSSSPQHYRANLKTVRNYLGIVPRDGARRGKGAGQ